MITVVDLTIINGLDRLRNMYTDSKLNWNVVSGLLELLCKFYEPRLPNFS